MALHPAAPRRLGAAFGALGVGGGVFVVLYCRAHNTMAARLWWMLRALGWEEAAVLDGGFVKWRAEGRPVEAGVRVHP